MSVTKAEEQRVNMKITVSTKHRDSSDKTLDSRNLDLNKHLLGTEHMVSSDVISRIKKKTNYSVLFEILVEIILSKSSYKITSFIDFSPDAKMFAELKQ